MSKPYRRRATKAEMADRLAKIMPLLDQGLDCREIAAQLGLRYGAVWEHIRGAYRVRSTAVIQADLTEQLADIFRKWARFAQEDAIEQ